MYKGWSEKRSKTNPHTRICNQFTAQNTVQPNHGLYTHPTIHLEAAVIYSIVWYRWTGERTLHSLPSIIIRLEHVFNFKIKIKQQQQQRLVTPHFNRQSFSSDFTAFRMALEKFTKKSSLVIQCFRYFVWEMKNSLMEFNRTVNFSYRFSFLFHKRIFEKLKKKLYGDKEHDG